MSDENVERIRPRTQPAARPGMFPTLAKLVWAIIQWLLVAACLVAVAIVVIAVALAVMAWSIDTIYSLTGGS